LVDMSGRVAAANPAACEFFGLAEDELVGMLTPVAARPDSPRHETSRALIGHLLDGTIDRYEDEKRYVRKDGREIWGHLTVTVVRDDNGVPEHFMTLWQDVTARKQAEDDLQVAEERFHAAFEHSPIGMAITDLAGRVLQANRALGAIAKATVGERCALLHCQPSDLRLLVGGAVPFVRHEQRYTSDRSPARWAEVTAALVSRSAGCRCISSSTSRT
jgi:PAS domain S-box-containing protein